MTQQEENYSSDDKEGGTKRSLPPTTVNSVHKGSKPVPKGKPPKFPTGKYQRRNTRVNKQTLTKAKRERLNRYLKNTLPHRRQNFSPSIISNPHKQQGLVQTIKKTQPPDTYSPSGHSSVDNQMNTLTKGIDVMNIHGEKNINSAPPPSSQSTINQSNSINSMMEVAIKGTFNMFFSNNPN